MSIIAKDGVHISIFGSIIKCSNGEIYHLSGKILNGPSGTISTSCSSINEALSIVIDLHGGDTREV